MSANVEKLHKNSSEFIENNCQNRKKQSKDEVDFVRAELFPPFKTHTTITTDGNHNNQLTISHKNNNNNNNNSHNSQCSLLSKKLSPGTLYGDCEVKTSIKSSLSTLEKFSLFNLAKKKIDQNSIQNSTTNSKDKTKFVKTPSLARLLGNTYNTKKSESELMNSSDLGNNGKGNSTTPVNGSRRFGNAERFHKSSKEDVLSEVSLQDFREDKDLSAKAFRTISRSLGKLWWRRTHSVDISAPDPEYKVSYLGNVLTGWAKGEGCIEKPLNTLWRNYTQNHKPDVIMRMKICASGLKATTRQHGLTEYWANRITYCCAPQNYPRVFCWIYRHEGRKLKHELRCHAVLCSKESIAQDICATLRDNLDRALRDFKREKISKQNARLSLANSVYENPSLPRRKILLSVGGNNYRPPMERSKSAPKLMAIEEAIGEEEGDDIEQTNEPEMQSCCQKDSLYPAMTLGRRRCRRGHSIRRTGKILKSCNSAILLNQQEQITTKESSLLSSSNTFRRDEIKQNYSIIKVSDENEKTKSNSSLGSDEDDLEKVLSYHNYDTNSPLAGELLSYFDMKINMKMSSNLLDDETIIFAPSLPSDRPPRSSLSMDNLDNCSDDEVDCHHNHHHPRHHHHHHHHHHDNHDDDLYDDLDYTDDVFLRQSAILNLFHRNSLRRLTNLSIQNDENCIEPVKPDSTVMSLIQQQQHLDSDEGSISSGCETASTVTANMDDTSLKYAPNNNNHHQKQQEQQEQQQQEEQQQQQQQKSEIQQLGDDDNIELDQKQNFNETHQMATMPNETNEIKICNATINFKLSRPLGSIKRIKARNNRNRLDGDVSDSEISDESGFAEFQEQNLLQRSKTVTV